MSKIIVPTFADGRTLGTTKANGNLAVGLVFVFAYVFDEVMNGIIGNNFAGLGVLLLYGLLYCLQGGSRNLVITKSWIAYFSLMSAFSFVAFMSPLGCSVELKGLVSLIMAGMFAFFFRQIFLARMVLNTFISNSTLYLILTLLVFDVLGIGIREMLYGSSRGSGPYSEPSHLAVYLIPIVGFRLLVSPRDKLAILTLGVSFLAAPSSTLLVGALGMLCLRMLCGHGGGRKWLQFIFISIVFLLLVYAGMIDMTTTWNRIENIAFGYQAEKANHTNLSSLVWLNGWSQAYQTINETNWLGTGFNQMGCGKFYEIGIFSSLIMGTSGVVLNANDGSFLASKIVAELGVFGIITVLGLVVFSIRAISEFGRSKYKNNSADSTIILLRSVGGLCVLIFLFVRGTGGYFQLPFLVALSMLSVSLPKKLTRISKAGGDLSTHE